MIDKKSYHRQVHGILHVFLVVGTGWNTTHVVVRARDKDQALRIATKGHAEVGNSPRVYLLNPEGGPPGTLYRHTHSPDGD